MSLLLLFTIVNCAAQERIIYKDVPADHTVVKSETLDSLVKEIINTKRELLECIERERK